MTNKQLPGKEIANTVLEIGLAYGLPLLEEILVNGIPNLLKRPEITREDRVRLMSAHADLVEAGFSES